MDDETVNELDATIVDEEIIAESAPVNLTHTLRMVSFGAALLIAARLVAFDAPVETKRLSMVHPVMQVVQVQARASTHDSVPATLRVVPARQSPAWTPPTPTPNPLPPVVVCVLAAASSPDPMSATDCAPQAPAELPDLLPIPSPLP